jgi:hypothetical protein
MRFAEIHIWTCLVLFILSFAIDVVNIRYMMCIHPPKPFSGANHSVGLLLLTSIGILGFTENIWNLIPIACGYWAGTYITLWYEKRKR